MLLLKNTYFRIVAWFPLHERMNKIITCSISMRFFLFPFLLFFSFFFPIKKSIRRLVTFMSAPSQWAVLQTCNGW
uniref:Uncharacterized protein n=1 Tax=Arundo donax TaxID=35708 RepID=A0A0A9FQ13_ARUDO